VTAARLRAQIDTQHMHTPSALAFEFDLFTGSVVFRVALVDEVEAEETTDIACVCGFARAAPTFLFLFSIQTD
jgi:hypothetical protein